VGCSLASSLVALKKQLKRNVDPDLLFIEPSEMVVTHELRDVAAMGLRDIHYETGPFITLVDGPLFEFLWSERRALLLGQVKDADLVAVSRVDLIGDDELENINNLLDDFCGPLTALSAHSDTHMEKVVNLIN
jgi:G3E family GTPase